MKNFSLLRFAAILTLVSFLFISCSKDSLSNPQQNSSTVTSVVVPNDAPQPDAGAITANIVFQGFPVSMTVYSDVGGTANDSFQAFADRNGDINITDIPVGTYTVVFHAHIDDTNLNIVLDIVVENVIIEDGVIVDLGTIQFTL